MKDYKKTESEVLSVYKKVNPSTYWIEKDEDELLKIKGLGPKTVEKITKIINNELTSSNG